MVAQNVFHSLVQRAFDGIAANALANFFQDHLLESIREQLAVLAQLFQVSPGNVEMGPDVAPLANPHQLHAVAGG